MWCQGNVEDCDAEETWCACGVRRCAVHGHVEAGNQPSCPWWVDAAAGEPRALDDSDVSGGADDMREHLRALLGAGSHWLVLTGAPEDTPFLRGLLDTCQRRARTCPRRPVVECVSLELSVVDPLGVEKGLGPLHLLVIPRPLLPVEVLYDGLQRHYGPHGGRLEDLTRAAMVMPMRLEGLWAMGARVRALQDWLQEED